MPVYKTLTSHKHFLNKSPYLCGNHLFALTMEMKIKNKGQATLFQSKKLELLTKTSPQIIFSIYVPIILAMLLYSLFTLSITWYLRHWLLLCWCFFLDLI
jgi:hypothetical protein